jgi:glycosyltransferase involved in cell wall biosynthesis
MSTRVVVVLPEPTPYRSPVLDLLSRRDDLEVTVVYAAASVAGRTWAAGGHHDSVHLRGMRIPGARRLLRHDYPVSPGVWRQLSRRRPDCLVVSGWSTFASQAAIVWARVHRVPYVLLVESHDLGRRAGWRRAVKQAVVPRLVRRASAVLVVGSMARRSMLERGANPDLIHVFANTVDVERFAARALLLRDRRSELRQRFGFVPAEVVVACVARLVPEKGIDVLIHAAARATSRPALLLVGSGAERAPLEQLAATLGVHAEFVGDLPWDRISEAYVAADAFALLSRHEPWGVVVNEAAASGLPLLLSDEVGAAFDLLRPGENGVRVPAEDVGAAAAALDLLAQPDVRSRYSASSRTIASAWGYGPSIEAFTAAVQQAISPGG